MTNQIILQTALRQSAIDSGCRPEDFLKHENVTVLSAENPSARRYLQLPFDCDLVSYGNNIVASVSPELKEAVSGYINRFPAEHCFETPNLHVLSEILAPFDLQVCFMAEYFLPDVNKLQSLPCPFEVRMLSQKDFAPLYTADWSNALCERRKHLDVIGAGAYHNGELIGLAGASADCDTMWQIGIDVLPAYRQSGVGAALVSRLAAEILEKGIVPFYCAAWSNIKSVRCAYKSGFLPVWVELTAKSRAFVSSINHQ